jgi:hypothetical protein
MSSFCFVSECLSSICLCLKLSLAQLVLNPLAHRENVEALCNAAFSNDIETVTGLVAKPDISEFVNMKNERGMREFFFFFFFFFGFVFVFGFVCFLVCFSSSKI